MLGYSKATASVALACAELVAGPGLVWAANWTQYGFNAQHTDYNKFEKTITTSNVQGLHTSFTVDLFDTIPPAIVVNGVVFLSNSGSGAIEAINAKTGGVKWTSSVGCFGGETTVPAYAHGRL